MRVLSHGVPFCCDGSQAVELYSGPHDIRTWGPGVDVEFRYDPVEETACQVIARISKEWRPDLLLCWLPEVVPPPMGIEEVPVRTVALVSDWNVFYPILSVNLARYDLVLCDRHGVDVFRSALVTPHYLFPLYSQVSPLHKPYGLEKDIDVLFVGNLNHAAHARRARFLEQIARLSDRYRVVITADVRGEEYGRLLSRARIVFNHSIRGEANLRIFETIACGSLPFMEEENLEVRDWFTPGEDVVLYNRENLEERITYYLEHPGEAQVLTGRARARAPEFAGENRLTRLIEWAMEEPGQGRGFRGLPEPEQEYETLRMYGRSPSPIYRPIEVNVLNGLLGRSPDDPRVLTAAGLFLLNEASKRSPIDQDRVRCLKPFARAAEVCPDSVPYRFNVAAVFRFFGMPAEEEVCLRRVLEASTIEGADTVVGSGADPFYVRWQLAVAEKKAACGALHAEALIRLAELHVRRGEGEPAVEMLLAAGRLEPEAVRRLPLLAETYWRMGRRVEAVDTLREALPDLPMDIQVRQRLCDMLIELGAKEEARTLAEESLAIARACVDPPIP